MLGLQNLVGRGSERPGLSAEEMWAERSFIMLGRNARRAVAQGVAMSRLVRNSGTIGRDNNLIATGVRSLGSGSEPHDRPRLGASDGLAARPR